MENGNINYDHVGNDLVTQALLRALNRVAKAPIGGVSRGTIAERLRSNVVELFRGIAGITPIVAEYWMETTEKILEDLECTPEQKLKGVVSMLRDKAYRWWQPVVRGTLPECIDWAYFQEAFQGMYVGPRYMGARRLEFIKLKQGDKTVSEYKAEFLEPSMVASEQEKSFHFQEGLRYDLKVQVAPHQETVFEALVEKTKIIEEIKCVECKRKGKHRDHPKREMGPTGPNL
ncbi:uncharacterized protein [Gossypium hirsutum]|uniref:Retrotransposon gag domain-containing protein n=1 Tax=Gossypium hirsutum TaxID=3635 RepID=A0A1U8J0X7_GOSHI|nr:uncharacterized protein LOC107902301 [Gossypium hirsutum]